MTTDNRVWIIYDRESNLFWHNGVEPENEGFSGWGHPLTASRYTEEERDDYEYIAGADSIWVRLSDPEVTNWVDPDE